MSTTHIPERAQLISAANEQLHTQTSGTTPLDLNNISMTDLMYSYNDYLHDDFDDILAFLVASHKI